MPAKSLPMIEQARSNSMIMFDEDLLIHSG